MDLGITLSKLLPLLVYPFNVSLWLLVSATALLWFGRRRWAAALLGVNVALLLVCASPPLARLGSGSRRSFTRYITGSTHSLRTFDVTR